MVITAQFKKKFFEGRDDTGRFMVVSYRTGVKYYVEPIESAHTPKWGDVNPATGKVEGDYGGKHRGGIYEKDSMITKENGFDKIHYTGVGGSPMGMIDEIDSKYKDK